MRFDFAQHKGSLIKYNLKIVLLTHSDKIKILQNIASKIAPPSKFYYPLSFTIH